MDRYIGGLVALLLLSSCACALNDEDKEAGKPPITHCIIAGFIKTKACETKTTGDPTQCPH